MARRVLGIPWHPVALALYPILLLFNRNADSVRLSDILAAALVTLGLTALGWLILAWLRVGVARAALIVSATLFVVFAFERNVYALQVRGLAGSPIAREAIVLAMETGLLVGWVTLLARRPRFVPVGQTMANVGSVVLLLGLMPGTVGAIRADRAESIGSFPVPPRVSEATRVVGGPRHRDPDIYFIVLDAYGRSDTLRDVVGFDNSAFLDRMRRKGFFVVERSTSNYCQTALSISATLNSAYHQGQPESDSKPRLPLRDLVSDNSTIRILRGRGYRLVSFATGFNITDHFPAEVRLAPPYNLSEFTSLLLDTTPWGFVTGQGAGRAGHARHRARIAFALNHLPEVAGDPAPMFTFAHILAPHPPFVFGRDGSDRSADTPTFRLTDGRGWSDIPGHGGPDDYARRYRDQVAYLTDRVEMAVSQILARSVTPPVIIIQGDHGSATHFRSDSPEPNDLAERFSNLNLILLPGGSDQLDPTLSSVNTFRVVLDTLFHLGRGRLPDRNYYSSYQTPYQLIDVTDRVQQATAALPHQ